MVVNQYNSIIICAYNKIIFTKNGDFFYGRTTIGRVQV